MIKILLSIFIIFIFQSRAYADNAISKVMGSWQGEHIDTVFKYWGYPNDEKTIAGHKLLYWYHNQSPQYIQTSASTSTVTQSYCTRILEINEHNKVTSWQYERNSCPNFYFTSQSWVNPNNDPWQNEKLQREMLKQEKKKLKQKNKGEV
ncbi:MAG: hypothetical protein NC408_09925 [Candidatus Gastranaerophilales bacterium]|nr:hypothetical protein [Candidatus Gastranaerophilales bacterium]MCM1074003.1 hypothetical protein [Bacteroides sp.]